MRTDRGETGATDGRPRTGSRGRPLGTLSRIRGTLPLRWWPCSARPLAALAALWAVGAGRTAGATTGVRVPTPVDTWSALTELWTSGTLWGDLSASADPMLYGYGIGVTIGIVVSDMALRGLRWLVAPWDR